MNLILISLIAVYLLLSIDFKVIYYLIFAVLYLSELDAGDIWIFLIVLENIDKMAYFIMALPLQRLDFSVADILLYQSIAIVWPKLLRVLVRISIPS